MPFHPYGPRHYQNTSSCSWLNCPQIYDKLCRLARSAAVKCFTCPIWLTLSPFIKCTFNLMFRPTYLLDQKMTTKLTMLLILALKGRKKITIYSQNKIDSSNTALPLKKRKSNLSKSRGNDWNLIKSLAKSSCSWRHVPHFSHGKFWTPLEMLNSFLDTRPTKNNLSQWGKRINTKCDLCGCRKHFSMY